jgi:chemotaxis signal transduction protein
VSVRFVPWLRFEMNGRDFALPIECVAEVLDSRRPRLIPCVGIEVAGIVNFRGEPLPAVDGGALILDTSVSGHRHMVVLDDGTWRVAMLVSRVVRIERRMAHAVPMDEPPEGPALAQWVLVSGQQLGLLDPPELMERARELLTRQPDQVGGMPCPGAF